MGPVVVPSLILFITAIIALKLCHRRQRFGSVHVEMLPRQLALSLKLRGSVMFEQMMRVVRATMNWVLQMLHM